MPGLWLFHFRKSDFGYGSVPPWILASKLGEEGHYSIVKSVFIYALRCPVTNDIRYVGKAENPARRYKQHLAVKGKYHRGCWVRSLQEGGHKPTMEILDEVPELEWPMWEVAYIQFFREEGCDLVNGNDGGAGGINPTAEICAKISASKLGEKHHFFGKKQSVESCAKRSAALKGMVRSPETREKMSASARRRTPEHYEKAWATRREKLNAKIS